VDSSTLSAGHHTRGVAEALRLWLLGQLFEMVLIGALSTFAVWLASLPVSADSFLIWGRSSLLFWLF
jgi:hypothetical protein